MITPRLECILKQARGKITADIGCDHAYIPIRLIQDGISERVIASDVREGPCLAARRHIEKYSLTDKIEVRMGSGLSTLSPGEADEIIIAGMGGDLIAEIIEADKIIASGAKRLILQPMNAQDRLRHYLFENGFNIIHEDLAAEGFKIYNIITAAEGSGEKFDREIYYHIPYYLKNHSFYTMLYNKKHREFTKILSGLKKSAQKDELSINKYEFLLKELESIK